ncbi:MAG: DJ-1/PfpI family protein [Pseudomonadota bacterium]
MSKSLLVGAVIFDEFELLDMFGPLEMLGMYPDTFELQMIAEKPGPMRSAQGPSAHVDATFSQSPQFDILLVPGGRGTRDQVENAEMLDWLRSQASAARYVSSVCTGSALLAKAGVLDGMSATTNKAAFSWVTSQGPEVSWVAQARWVEDGKFFTASGVSAGMDMTLALIAHIMGDEAADQVATWTEYDWHRDPSWDPFAEIHNLV